MQSSRIRLDINRQVIFIFLIYEMFINVMSNFRIHVAVSPVFIMRPASMDLQTRDTSAYVQRVTLEKTVKKVSPIFFFSSDDFSCSRTGSHSYKFTFFVSTKMSVQKILMTALPKLFVIISKGLIIAAVKKVIMGTAEIAQVRVGKKCSHGDRQLILEKNITFQKKDNESQVW